ncbi:hypothetical protein GCM10010300_83480 [Streptomyces olivaceoviridis]|uniref:hypothetical protein n=1 Tax=Streptomyces olivaceoviridis TaxID=1921 RepID=UPI001676DBBF|nr:hypothetical protein [Streptomyces olivaceoviridis]GGZ27561.1 hypothetical protein GCM10010300_83480 [Streptomyces olivaceoviridis]
MNKAIRTKAFDKAVGDEADGEADEGFVDVVSSFPADPRAAEAAQPGDGAFDDPAEDAWPEPCGWPRSANRMSSRYRGSDAQDVESAQARRRAVNAPRLVALVRAGARFERGHLVERPETLAA